MIKYDEIKVLKLSDKEIDEAYLNLIKEKYSFVIINYLNEKYVLTKEKSIFKIDNIEKFLCDANNDVYYRSIVSSEKKYLKEDVDLFYEYIEKYKLQMLKKYGGKYLFGSVAVRTIDDAFITTIRGKENLKDFVVVNSIDDENYIVNVSDKKATLNAPLLNYLFKN